MNVSFDGLRRNATNSMNRSLRNSLSIFTPIKVILPPLLVFSYNLMITFLYLFFYTSKISMYMYLYRERYIIFIQWISKFIIKIKLKFIIKSLFFSNKITKIKKD